MESTENYLETILLLSNRIANVRSIDVAKETGFSKPSISEAMKKLKSQGLINICSCGYITLTDKGLCLATAVLNRHETLVSIFLSIGVPKDIASKDACKIEHVINEITFNKLKEHFNL